MSLKHPIDPQLERQIAIDLFNFVWTLLEKPDRTPAEDDAMLHAAHASRYHWGQVGTPVNLARGEWQVSRVYAVRARSESALYHAQRCLEICRENRIGDFDLAFAYEAIARAHAVAGWPAQRDEALASAWKAAEDVREADDREWLEKNLREIAEPPGRV